MQVIGARDGSAGVWSTRRALLPALVTAMLYLAASRYVLVLNDPVNLGAGFWPGAGITVGALLLCDRRSWPAILAAVGLTELGNDLNFGYGLVPSLWWSLGNVVEPLVAASLVRRWRAARLCSVGDTLRFVVGAAVLAPTIGGLIGVVGTVAWGSDQPYLLLAAKWAVGDGLGILAITPAALLLVRPEARARVRSREALVVFAATLGMGLLVFRNWPGAWDVTLPYLVLPPLVWAAVRIRLVGAAVAIFLVAQLANAMTAFGYGPFALAGASSREAILLLQLFLATVSVTVLLLGSRTTEKDHHERTAITERRRADREHALAELSRTALGASTVAELWDGAEPHLVAAGEPHVLQLITGAPGSGAPEVTREGHAGGELEVFDDGTVAAVAGGQGDMAFGLLMRAVDGPVDAEDRTMLTTARTLLELACRRIDAETALATTNRELRDALTAKQNLLSVVSHELRAPLTPIAGFAEVVLRHETELTDASRRGLETIMRNSDHLLRLIEDLLTLSQIDRRQLTPDPTVLELQAFAAQLLADLDLPGVHLAIDPAATVGADEGHLRQILTNLVTNAFRHGAPPVRIEARKVGGELDLCVTDCGGGIDPSFLPHLFDPFRQDGRRGSSAARGLGLGLSIARELARLNGGDLDYDEAHRGGARFVVRLPTRPAVGLSVARGELDPGAVGALGEGAVTRAGAMPGPRDLAVTTLTPDGPRRP